MDADAWTKLQPRIKDSESGNILRGAAHAFVRTDPLGEDSLEKIAQARSSWLNEALRLGDDTQVVRSCISALADLRAQDWDFRISEADIWVKPPPEHTSPEKEKARVRSGLLIQRDAQLRKKSVRDFVRDMERQRLGPDGDWVSIFSLMRDGEDLSGSLADAVQMESEQRASALERTIQPYLQLADDSECSHTGLPLKSIWRYFRHTWVSPHKTLPGRNMWFLVRDAATEYHPVIGIAALGSAVVQQKLRDDYIGWSKDNCLGSLPVESTDELKTHLEKVLDSELTDIYLDDFFEKGIVERSDLENPTAEVIARLQEEASRAREEHRLYSSSREHKSNGPADWHRRTMTPLYVSKRAKRLADILDDRNTLNESKLFTDAESQQQSSRQIHDIVWPILKRIKARHVGIDMLDITVCGAIAPYNHILGGKLVSLLMLSPEVRRCYEEKYGDRSSIIASSMAGRPIIRKPRLVLLCTTSLYGVGSSQYNRLRLPADRAGGQSEHTVEYKELGTTAGYGSFHFSDRTMKELRTLLAQENHGRTVKHIFGEGANPRMREIREALERAGLPSDRLLRHGSSRVVYAIPLAANFRSILVGSKSDPEYYLPSGGSGSSSSSQIVCYWMDRWLLGRIGRDGILDRVAKHDLSHPVAHGARVELPPADESLPFFANLDSTTQ